MGRSQVLYNRTSARFRAARGNGRNNPKSGGRGSAVSSSPHSHQHQPRQPPGRYADDEDDEQQEESNDDIQYHHHHPQQNTTISSSADRKEQEAQHILSYDSVTSTYASRIPIAQLLLTDDQNLDGDHDQQQQQHPWKSFLHTTPTTTTGLETSHPLRNTNTFITTEEWCSQMAKALETSLSRAERLRMPEYLVETIYGRTAATTTVENKKTTTTPKHQQPSSLLPRSAREPPASTAAAATTTTSSTTKTDTRIRLDPSPPASSSGEDTPSGVFLLKTRGSLLEGPRRRDDDDDDDPPPPPASSLEDVSMDQWLDSTLQPPSPSKKTHVEELAPKQSDEEEEENLDEWLDSVIS
jgi:hypothetical protein